MDAGVGSAPARLIQHCLALIAGVLLVHVSAQLPSLLQLLVIATPSFLSWRFRSLWAVAVLGIVLSVWQAEQLLADRWPPSRHGEQIIAEGLISNLPERAPGFSSQAEDTLRFEFSPFEHSLPGRIRVSWYEASDQPQGGECWRLTLRMRAPHGSLNPGGFDYEAWLYRRGIGATASVRAASRCEASAHTSILRARQSLVNDLQQWLGGHPAQAMIAALTVGDDSGFSDTDWDLFRHTGTSHLVAISGFNVAIVAGLAFFLLRWTWPLSERLCTYLPAQKAGMLGAALFGLLYGMLAGWDSPAQRAALMLALLLIAALPDRLASPWKVLLLVGAAMLSVDPASILSPGLWLSFVAVAAIFFLSMGRLRTDKWWLLAVRIQLMLSIVLAPLSLAFFQGTTWLGIPVNLIAVPVMVVMTPAVVGSVAVAWLLPVAGVPLLNLVADALVLLLAGLDWVASNAPASWVAASPYASVLLLAALAACLLSAPRGLPLRPLALLCFVPLFLPQQAPIEAPFELTALDVGQGLAVQIRTPNHAMVYDAGPAFRGGFDAGESVVVPSLLQQGLRRIDLLMLSHGDRDHAGGVGAVLKAVSVDRQIGTAGGEACTAGQAWQWDAVKFEVLHPQALTDGSDNDQSCVLKVSAPGFSALLTGDIEWQAEQALLRVHPDRLEADLLFAPHHGSKTSSSAEFIDAVSPAIVVFAAGWRSHFGHPHPSVVERYDRAGALMLTTGVEGALRFWRDTEGEVRWQSARRNVGRFWNAPPEP